MPCSQIAGDPLAVGDEFLSDFQDPADVEIATDASVLMGSPHVDAVLDLTTHAMHAHIATSAFALGKHVLSQKPVASTIRQAIAMRESAITSGRVFGTFECFRYLPLTRALAWLFRSGRGGRLQMVLLGYVGAWWAPDIMVADTPWRHRRSQGGGITLDLGVHFFDQLRLVAGEPVAVTGRVTTLEPRRRPREEMRSTLSDIDADADDTCFATLEFPGGVITQLSASWAGYVAPTLSGSGSVYYGTRARVDGGQVAFDDGSSEDLVELYFREEDRAELDRRFPRGVTDWFALGQHDWLEAIRHGRSPEVSGEEGLRDLAATLAILESSQAGRRVTVDEVLSGRLSAFQDTWMSQT
jgi:predicted dehydrogenase